jgi:hypothetical protein
MPKRLLIVDDIRIRATAKTGIEPKIPINRHRNSDNSGIDVTCVIISNFSFYKIFQVLILLKTSKKMFILTDHSKKQMCIQLIIYILMMLSMDQL